MNQPLVSVIIPTYNRTHIMGETLNSVLAQTYGNWECIVVDDGSNDATDELMEFYSEKDSRIQYYRRPSSLPKGANACRNYGFSRSKGEYIQWLDSDDMLSADKISKQIELLQTRRGILATCEWGRISENGDNTIFKNMDSYNDFNSPLSFLNKLITSQGYFPIHAYLMKRTLVKQAGPWLNYLNINQDGEFMMRIIFTTNKIYFAKNVYAFYRRSGSDSTSILKPGQFEELINSWRLIESYSQIRFPNKDLIFIKEVKRRIFIKYRENTQLIKQHKFFFRTIIREEPSDLKLIFFRVINRYKASRDFLKFVKKLKGYIEKLSYIFSFQK